MKQVLVIHAGSAEFSTRVEVLGQPVQLRHIGCGGDIDKARELLTEHDGLFQVMAIEGFPVKLQLGSEERLHAVGGRLLEAATMTPVVDGSSVRSALERWGVMLAERAEPGIFTDRRVLMVPGLNHGGMAHALSLRARQVRYADTAMFFGPVRLPGIGKIGSPTTGARLARAALRRLRRLPVECFTPPTGRADENPGTRSYRWAEVLAGDLSLIRRLAPRDLRGKTIVTEFADAVGLEDLHDRGASCVVTLMPALVPDACDGTVLLGGDRGGARRGETRPDDGAHRGHLPGHDLRSCSGPRRFATCKPTRPVSTVSPSSSIRCTSA